MDEGSNKIDQVNLLADSEFPDLRNKYAFKLLLEEKPEGFFVAVNISNIQDLKSQFRSYVDLVNSFVKDLCRLSLKHYGVPYRLDLSQFVIVFATEERAVGFSEDLHEEVSHSIKSVRGLFKIRLNIGIGSSPDTALNGLVVADSKRASHPHDHLMDHSIAMEGEQLEPLGKAYGDSDEDKEKIIKQLYRNHLLTTSYLKNVQNELSSTPFERRHRVQVRVDRALKSHVETKKYLHDAIDQYHGPENKQKVLDRLFTQEMQDQERNEFNIGLGSREGEEPEDFDKSEFQEMPPGEYKILNHKQLENTLKTGNFALLSGYSSNRTPQENEEHHKALLNDLRLKKYSYTPLVGTWNKSKEPSFMIHNIPPDEAMALGHKYGQYSVVQSSAGKHTDVATHPNYHPLPGGEGHEVGDHFDDNYSTVDLAEGGQGHFRVNLGVHPDENE